MASVFRFQDPGEGINEAEVLTVLVGPGDQVTEGQEVLTVETDKASFDLASPHAGVVEEIKVQEGDIIHVGDVLMSFAETGAPERQPREKPPLAGPGRQPAGDRVEQPDQPGKDRESASRAPKEAEGKAGVKTSPSAQTTGPVPASPATRRVAQELKVDLREVPPSGEGGRVLTDDVRAFADTRAREGSQSGLPGRPAATRTMTPVGEAPPLPDFTQWGAVERRPLRSIRRETAKRMAVSWAQIPHVTHHDVADITELEAFRQRHVKDIELKGGKLTLTVLIMKAVVAALHEFPWFNASLDPESEEIILKRYYHLGIALDSERGLLVPVVRDVDRKSISELAVELSQLAARVRKGGVNRDDVMGGTFTITNPGPLGGTTFTPIINYPEVAILGLGRASLQPVVRGTLKKHEIVPRLMLPLSFGFDHRVNDGAEAVRFVNKVIRTLTDLEAFTLAI